MVWLGFSSKKEFISTFISESGIVDDAVVNRSIIKQMKEW